MRAFPCPLLNTCKTLTLQYKTDFKTKRMSLLFLLPALPQIYKLNCCYPIPEQFSTCSRKNDNISHKSASSSLQWLNVFQLQFSTSPHTILLFFHTPTLFLCSFFYFPPSACHLLHYFLHLGPHPSPSLFLTSNPFYVFCLFVCFLNIK